MPDAAEAPSPARFVLMNTAGNRNRDLAEPASLAERCVVGLVRLLLPPHADNEQAADYLRTVIGQDDPAVEWAVVRPDTLIDEDAVTAYVAAAGNRVNGYARTWCSDPEDLGRSGDAWYVSARGRGSALIRGVGG